MSFSQYNDKGSTKFDYIKAWLEFLGFEPGTAGMQIADESTELWWPPSSGPLFARLNRKFKVGKIAAAGSVDFSNCVCFRLI